MFIYMYVFGVKMVCNFDRMELDKVGCGEGIGMGGYCGGGGDWSKKSLFSQKGSKKTWGYVLTFFKRVKVVKCLKNELFQKPSTVVKP